MNIFRVHNNPNIAAQFLCDRHVVKMILESAQMLSTAHRLLDGEQIIIEENGRKKKQWIHPDPDMDENLYKAVHINHPCTVWTREGEVNYLWHLDHWIALCQEYTHRYGKTHASWTKLNKYLYRFPKNIPSGGTPFRPAVGPEPIGNDIVEIYRNYYKTKKDQFKMAWTGREIPSWFEEQNA